MRQLFVSSILPSPVKHEDELLDVFSLDVAILALRIQDCIEESRSIKLLDKNKIYSKQGFCSIVLSNQRHVQLSFPAEVIVILPEISALRDLRQSFLFSLKCSFCL